LGKAITGTRVEGVCRKAFCHSYGISPATFTRYAGDLKQNIVEFEAPLTDRTNISIEYMEEMRKIAERFSLTLTDQQLAGIVIPLSYSVPRCLLYR